MPFQTTIITKKGEGLNDFFDGGTYYIPCSMAAESYVKSSFGMLKDIQIQICASW